MKQLIFYLLITTALIAGDLTQTRDSLIAQVDSGQADAQTWIELLKTLRQLDDEKLGETYGRRALEALPQNAEARYYLAMALQEKFSKNQMLWMGGKDTYINLLKEAIELDPTLPSSYYGLIGFYTGAPSFIGGSDNKALAVADQMTAHLPVRGGIERAKILTKKGAHDQVIATYQSLIQNHHDNPTVAYNYALYLQQQEKYREAAAVVDGATHPPSIYQSARARILGGFELERAVKELDRFLAADYDGPFTPADAWWRKGVAYQRLGDQTSAEAAFRQALALNPEHDQAGKALASLN